MNRFQEQSRLARTLTRDALAKKLDGYLPEGHYRDYYAWALSTDNPQQDLFVRIIALEQLANMTTAILGDLGPKNEWPTLVRYALPVNLYQVFEVVSDNLSLGLAEVHPSKPSALRDLVIDFNKVAVTDLQQLTGRPATELLAHLRDATDQVSGSAQSLAAGPHLSIAADFAAKKGISVTDIDHTVWDGLVANIESGRDVLNAICGTHTEQLVIDTTIERYSAVNRTLTATHLSQQELVETGTQTILVAPTLGYFTAIFGEMANKDPGYLATLDDGSLAEIFTNASLLVRLQNDIGTTLLSMDQHQRKSLIHDLPLHYQLPQDSVDTPAIALLKQAATRPLFTRFRKDLFNGEFNICLYLVYQTHNLGEGLAVLTDELNYFADLYQHSRTLLRTQLAELEARLSDRRITEIIRRFVDFHEQLYLNPYEDISGDYAI